MSSLLNVASFASWMLVFRRRCLLLGALSLVSFYPALAQEGYPLDGTWRAQFESDAGPRNVVIIMKWDGAAVTGMINPGPNALNFSAPMLDAASWAVSLDVMAADGTRISLAGTLTDIGSYNRRIVGTWHEGGEEIAIELIRE